MDDKIKQLINQKQIFHGDLLQKETITSDAKCIILRDTVNWCYLISKRSKAVKIFYVYIPLTSPKLLARETKLRWTSQKKSQ